MSKALVVAVVVVVVCLGASSASQQDEIVSGLRERVVRRLQAIREPLDRRLRDGSKKRPLGHEQLSQQEREGIRSGLLCGSRSRAGIKRAFPRSGVLEYVEGRASVAGMECERSDRGVVCCRPLASTISMVSTEHPAYWKMLSRFMDYEPGSFRCFPSLIIAGAQKCGSTALTGYLLHHPGIRFARHKELHYFDKNESLCLGSLFYLAQFPARGEFLTAEATPFYLADPRACARIHAQLPWAKLVVVVREPISRARSEYAMKNRRVDAQGDFATALATTETSARLLECLVSAGPRNTSRGLAGCAPRSLRESTKFPLFRASVMKQLRAARADDRKLFFEDFLRECFEPLDDGSKLDVGVASRVFQGNNPPPYSTRFRIRACFPEGVRERLSGEFGDVMRREISQLNACASRNFEWGVVPETPDHAATLVDTCVKVHTGITIQYVYRGLYAAQIARCARSVDKNNLVVIESDDLRNTPQRELDRVAKALGIRPFSYDPRIFQTDNLQRAIRDKYPTFENSGWQLTTTYQAPLDPTLRAELLAFFKPHNLLFFGLAGRHFPRWLDDRHHPGRS
ncbi:hypothetical protein CTAYLR_001480 [Chrysophaeum taylorii]|uniref:Sulfotransferase n=1 Tax=Chrysophaeum taylorii TaxID=2483200 RepID=A0AAD7U912_9STRA|nr:hypothetical protein CTAYLR_001480 [Chrysophaeum taylorii]